jgi:hypothetical protein
VPGIEVIPFTPGRRPTDEARHPWLGSSDEVAFQLGDGTGNRCYVLFKVTDGEDCALDATLSAGGVTLWNRRPFPAAAFVDALPREVPLGADRPYVLTIAPDDLDVEVPFAGLPLDLGLRLTRDGEEVAAADASLQLYDVRQFGTLYAAVVERVVKPDTELQSPGLPYAYHPWFPVLAIGSYKAELYMRALVGDVVHKRRNLSDPGWLVRVGLYLELLTTIGIAEALQVELFDRTGLPDLSERLNVEGWKRVWRLRDIAPVGALNLLAKRRATLEFLHVHHEDLEHAI